MTAALILSAAVLSLGWWLGVLAMLASGWPVALPIAFVLSWAQSGRSAFWWTSRAFVWIDAEAEAVRDLLGVAWRLWRKRAKENRRMAA